MMKWTKKWWNDQWNDETLEGLSKSVKHTKYPSALAYDKMSIHVKGWVIMKGKCSKYNECGDNMIRGLCERWEQSQMSLSKCYQNILIYESVKLMKRSVSMNTLMKLLKLMHT